MDNLLHAWPTLLVILVVSTFAAWWSAHRKYGPKIKALKAEIARLNHLTAVQSAMVALGYEERLAKVEREVEYAPRPRADYIARGMAATALRKQGHLPPV